MEFTSRILKTRLKRQELLSKEIMSNVLFKNSTTTKVSSKLERKDSNRTTIDNVNISSAQNSEILSKKLRLPSKLRERSEEIRKKSPFNKHFRVYRPAIQRFPENFESKFRSPENLRFMQSDKNKRENVKDNFKEGHKTNTVLIPISLKYKSKLELSKLGSKNNIVKGMNLLDDYKNEENQFTFFALDKSEPGSPDIVRSLMSTKRPVCDWKKSVLYQNIKYDRGSPILFEGYYKTELIDLAINIPLDSSINLVLKKLFRTLEKLYIQLLRSSEDLEMVQLEFAKPTVYNVECLIEKCLMLYKFRDKTSWIIESILKRERVLKEAILRNLKNSKELFRISGKLQKKINRWLMDACAQFTEFVFNGVNYLSKMDKELALIQDLL